jgi:hypothetical protein
LVLSSSVRTSSVVDGLPDWAISKPDSLATKAAAISTRKIFFICRSYRPHSIPIGTSDRAFGRSTNDVGYRGVCGQSLPTHGLELFGFLATILSPETAYTFLGGGLLVWATENPGPLATKAAAINTRKIRFIFRSC